MFTEEELTFNSNFVIESDDDEQINQFISDNFALLKNKNFSTFYSLLYSEFAYNCVYILATQKLLLCGIDPLEYLDHIPVYFFAWLNIIQYDVLSNIKTIGSQAFYDCESLERVSIHEGIESIGSSAFAHCESLKSIDIPKSCVEIGFDAFYNCGQLEQVTIPKRFRSKVNSIFEKKTIKFTFI